MTYCSICFEQINHNKNFVCLPCNHVFHCQCAFEWLSINNSCPCCRSICGQKLNTIPTLSHHIFPYIIDTQVSTVISQIQISYFPSKFGHLRQSAWNDLSSSQKSQIIRIWLTRLHCKVFDLLLLYEYKYRTNQLPVVEYRDSGVYIYTFMLSITLIYYLIIITK